ncbi:hypothetical protein PhCBS80983_g06274 [Powellomyces hirtus]|uniref:Uncharacterized protein n=1 Tax=Powellomyces hirtus TaxID=109895 RepID=A0A507DRD7_9FUNG|nr:hypothetical protein PhCBS80983_g06274 [Powellomyces hirtus]
MSMPNINDMEGFPGPGLKTTEVRTVPNVFKYKRNAKNGVILNFQPSSQVRFEPTNGSQEVRPTGKVSFKIADEKRFWLVNETLHKYRVVGYKDGNEVEEGTVTYQLCQSGTDVVWKRQSVLIGGRIIEDLNNYNLFTAHENALSSWETKQHLGMCEYYSTEENDRSDLVAKNKAYTVTGSSLSFFQNDIAFPLALVKGGVTYELSAEPDYKTVFPNHENIDSYRIVDNELICQFAEPTAEYYEFLIGMIQEKHALAIPMQLVWSQEFDGSDTRVQQLSLVTGEQTSISSLILVTTDKDREDVDKLNYSDDAYIRTVSFQVGTQRFPEGKSISNGSPRDGKVTIDPEMYALSQCNKDFNNIAFAPTIMDMEGWELHGKKIKHWSLRQNFKQTPDMIGGGLQTLADGRILINISQYPNPPEITPNFETDGWVYVPASPAVAAAGDNPAVAAVAAHYVPGPIPKFKGKTFHVFWTTDHEMLIDYSGVRLLPA